MHKVTWTDAFGNSCHVEGDFSVCKDVFRLVVSQVIAGELDSETRLLDAKGNCVDSWAPDGKGS